MQTAQLVLPTLATLALGTALLMPLRDDRQGRRATLRGVVPLRPDFRVIDVPATIDVPISLAQPAVEPFLAEHDLDASTSVPLSARNGVDNSAVGTDVESLTAATRPKKPAFASSFVARVLGLFAAASSERPHTHEARESTSNVEANGSDASDTSGVGTTTIERSFAHEISRLLAPPKPNEQIEYNVAQTSKEPAFVSTEHPFSETLETQLSSAEPVVSRIRVGTERAVPLTRLPLRPLPETVTWPNHLEPPRGACSRETRHDVLRELIGGPASVDIRVLELAISQEDRVGRMLALRALRKTAPNQNSLAAFVEILRIGSDDERAFAVDALTTHGTPNDLVPAFDDRVEAVAARAALAYVGSGRRSDYLERLAPFLDTVRIESILILLAGIVE